ncbi:TetR/AcrR family transcriptional regulator [Streptomyces sp. NPDC058417]|uniref:TetR/AcrR family transcriptional regulator n=1 Tax=unclassified Streptomyces TaxID=2593676 RepID=UPI00365DFB8F
MSKQQGAATGPGTRGVGTKGMPRKDRERLILDAAADEFGAKGWARGSTAEVAARAGITKPMIYEYFRSKDGLYLACLDRAGPRLVAAVEAAQEGPADLTRATRTLAAVFRALEARPLDWDLVYDPTLPPDGPLHAAAVVYRRELNRLGAVGVGAFLDAARGSRPVDPLDADLVTHLWFGTVGAAVAWWRHHPGQSAQDMVDRCERVFSLLRP